MFDELITYNCIVLWFELNISKTLNVDCQLDPWKQARNFFKSENHSYGEQLRYSSSDTGSAASK